MYYFRACYTDGTWDTIKSKTPIHNSHTACQTCVGVKPISFIAYYWDQLWVWIKWGI